MNTTNDDCPSVVRRGNIVYGPTKTYEPLDGGLGRYILAACDKYADQVMQICGETGRSETFSSFKSRSIKVAAEMKRRGISKKDVVVICAPNLLDGSLVPAAALYLGAATASLDGSLSLRDTTHLLSLVEPKMIFVHETSVELIEDALENNGTEVEIVVFGSSDEYSTFDEFLVDANDDFEPENLDVDETAFIMFSSGTTGLPKGIIVTHRSIYLGTKIFCDFSGHGTCALHFSSFYWISGVMMFVSQFCDGARRVLANNFDAETVFELIEKYQVSTAFLASPNCHKISRLKSLDKYDTSSFKFVTFGGGPVAKEPFIKVRDMLPNTYCTIGYGMTELSGFASNFQTDEKELAYINTNSCGRPVINTILKIVDLETEKPVGVNKPGEIRLKSKSLMGGYYKKDSSDVYDSDGFVKTGDIGHFNEDCCLYVYDRIKEMFKYQSWHIVPASIESVIKEHPDVVEAVVFGVPNEEDGHHPACAITLSPNANVTEQDITDFVAERVIDRQTLRGGVYFIDEMPKTPSEKINRKKLQALILEKFNL